MKKSKPSGSGSKRSITRSVFEGIKDLGKQVVKTAVTESTSMAFDSAQSIIGGQPFPQHQNENSYDFPSDRMQSPEMMGMPGFGRKKEKPQDIEVFSFALRKEQVETGEKIAYFKQLINQIIIEVKKLEAENKSMINEAARISMEQMPENPGIYHIRFFEWILSTLKDIRKKVSESGSWLAVARGKQKKGYWGTAKKKGTSFTLSGERTAATQTG